MIPRKNKLKQILKFIVTVHKKSIGSKIFNTFLCVQNLQYVGN